MVARYLFGRDIDGATRLARADIDDEGGATGGGDFTSGVAQLLALGVGGADNVDTFHAAP